MAGGDSVDGMRGFGLALGLVDRGPRGGGDDRLGLRGGECGLHRLRAGARQIELRPADRDYGVAKRRPALGEALRHLAGAAGDGDPHGLLAVTSPSRSPA